MEARKELLAESKPKKSILKAYTTVVFSKGKLVKVNSQNASLPRGHKRFDHYGTRISKLKQHKIFIDIAGFQVHEVPSYKSFNKPPKKSNYPKLKCIIF